MKVIIWTIIKMSLFLYNKFINFIIIIIKLNLIFKINYFLLIYEFYKLLK